MFELSYLVHVCSVFGNLSHYHITFCSSKVLFWLHPHGNPFLYSWADTLLLFYASWIYVYALLSIVIYTACLWILNALCSPLSYQFRHRPSSILNRACACFLLILHVCTLLITILINKVHIYFCTCLSWIKVLILSICAHCYGGPTSIDMLMCVPVMAIPFSTDNPYSWLCPIYRWSHDSSYVFAFICPLSWVLT